jgi:glycosyltransferase involved in cell wall biosynthesis
MKVLFVGNLYHPYNGGAERILRILAEGVVRVGHQAVVVSGTKERGCAVREINGVKAYYLGIKNLYWPFDGYRPHPAIRALWNAIDIYNVPAGRAVGRVIDAEQPTFVHTQNLAGLSASVWSAVMSRGLPLIHTLHDYWLICGRSTMFHQGRVCERICAPCRAFSAPRRRLSRKLDFVVSSGEFLLRKHFEHGLFVDGPPTHAIHNASDIEIGELSDGGRAGGQLRLGFLGRIEPSKGIDVLLETMVKIPQGWEMYVAGRGSQRYEPGFRKQYESERIKFLGFVRPRELFAQIDVLVVPSVWNDPLPTVIFEAYAHGIPVIGSSRGGIPEQVEDGTTGFIFDHSRSGDLERVVRRFIDDPGLAARMRPEVLRKARRHTPAQLTKEYLALYDRLLGTSSASSQEIGKAGELL